MGLRIACTDERAPLPRPMALTLVCDGGPSLFPPAEATFRGPGGFVEQRAAATAAGWLERQMPQGRMFLCPDCALSSPTIKWPERFVTGCNPGKLLRG